ncbi:MAG: S-layer homology domain-containing protein [Oscillospiraceae bacterium]|nr:S-layer homology domain-containing protein [Oscillospiraceae bacterium]
MKQKALSLLLALCLLYSGVPVQASDSLSGEQIPQVSGLPDSGGQDDPVGIGWSEEVLHMEPDGDLSGESWVQHADLPPYAMHLYNALMLGSDPSGPNEYLGDDALYTLADTHASPAPDQTLDSVEEFLYTDPLFLSGRTQEFPLAEAALLEESHFVMDPTISEKSIRFSNLVEGDTVRTSVFNGVLICKIQKLGNDNFDAELQTAREWIVETYRAFDRDHPEVFWLGADAKVRVVTVTLRKGEEVKQSAYLFLVLADEKGFTLRAPDYNSAEKIAADVKERDRLVAEILATITETEPYAQVRALNAWLTRHNEYNTTPDLNTIGLAPHRCLAALRGSVGNNGPVCGGYSRAFKLLCDRLGIPCLLEEGFARSSATHAGEHHIWATVQMPNGKWYGMDVTWNDPPVLGVKGARSGHESEKFLLVGSSTEIQGLRYGDSHVPAAPLTAGAADAGIVLSQSAYTAADVVPSAAPPTAQPTITIPRGDIPLAALPMELPFFDVPPGTWFFDAVRAVFEAGIMTGTGNGAFSPHTATTRAQLVTMLYRMADSPDVEPGDAFSDVPPVAWYAKPVAWAVGEGLVLGYADGSFGPTDALTRQQLAAILWRYALCPDSAGALEQFADVAEADGSAVDGLRWCVERGIVTGRGEGLLDPRSGCTRAEAAAMLSRFLKLEA